MEGTDPAIVMRLLNGYLDGVAKIIFSHDGTVMKVIGDAVHAIFGAPVSQKDHAARAVACALDIDDFSEAFRADWIKQGVDLGATRIGINTGDAIIGNFGGESYFDYSAYGDAVNLAARLEAANKVLGTRICISESVVEHIEGFCGRPAGKLNIAGKSEPIMAFEPLRDERAKSEDIAQYRQAYEKMATGDEDAKSAFAALMARMPEDPLVLLHLKRTLGGTCTDTITEVVK
ncbi:adenylate/guanylate cyclase domain-containing protein [Rhodobacteraceae bacterium D3-12]|nr:adenylate/guanylate cyclase domain-containing protein [Rhodobacteraceae bacterium D3-12]